MDTIASLLTDVMVDSLISKYAKFHKGETVHCKVNQREVVIANVIYDNVSDAIYYDIRCGHSQYHVIPEYLLTATA